MVLLRTEVMLLMLLLLLPPPLLLLQHLLVHCLLLLQLLHLRLRRFFLQPLLLWRWLLLCRHLLLCLRMLRLLLLLMQVCTNGVIALHLVHCHLLKTQGQLHLLVLQLL